MKYLSTIPKSLWLCFFALVSALCGRTVEWSVLIGAALILQELENK